MWLASMSSDRSWICDLLYLLAFKVTSSFSDLGLECVAFDSISIAYLPHHERPHAASSHTDL